MNIFRAACVIAAFSAIGLLAAGCDLDNHGSRKHNPPDGYGALVVENNSSRDIRVYIDGKEAGKVSDYSNRPFDLLPGVHRIILDERHGDRSWRDDVDIIEARLTILDVSSGWDNDFDVRVFFD
ncbi:MAG: hypothetical protein M5U15_01435 [Kiritimatiellae bacterium]|nr:hypothetical protein [Kiritimatiellia bacterium]